MGDDDLQERLLRIVINRLAILMFYRRQPFLHAKPTPSQTSPFVDKLTRSPPGGAKGSNFLKGQWESGWEGIRKDRSRTWRADRAVAYRRESTERLEVRVNY